MFVYTFPFSAWCIYFEFEPTQCSNCNTRRCWISTRTSHYKSILWLYVACESLWIMHTSLQHLNNKSITTAHQSNIWVFKFRQELQRFSTQYKRMWIPAVSSYLLQIISSDIVLRNVSKFTWKNPSLIRTTMVSARCFVECVFVSLAFSLISFTNATLEKSTFDDENANG